MSAFHAYPTIVDGVLHAPGAGSISTDDQGFQLGLAVFETLLCEQGCAYDVAEHLERLSEGVRALGLAAQLPFDVERAIARYVAALGPRDAALRVTVTRGVPGLGPSLVVGARDIVHPPDPGVIVVIERDARVSRSSLASVKSTNRLRNVLAREAAVRAGAFEALLCTDEGDVCEGTISNVFAVIDGVVVTPALDRGCLAGVQRGKILELLARGPEPVRVGRLEIEDLARASEVFLSNTTGRAIPVVEVGGVIAGLPGASGRLANWLRAGLRAREEEYRRKRAV